MPFVALLAVVGCGGIAAAAASSPDAGAAVADRIASTPAVQARLDDTQGLAASSVPGGEALVIPAAVTDTFYPGAALDVWLNDRRVDLQTLTSGPSLGQAVVQGDYFRYSSVLGAANLRSHWGQPLVLKWSAYLQISKEGDHVFGFELAERQRTEGALWVRTLVKLNGETLFEESEHLLLSHNLLKSGQQTRRLRPGPHRLEVWLAVQSTKAPSPQLGTYISMREPGLASVVPLEAVRLTHLR